MRIQLQQAFRLSFVRIVVATLIILAAHPGCAAAQQNNAPASSVPPVIQFNGQFNGQSGGTAGSGAVAVPAGTVSITFTLFEDEQGGTALWSETQNVQVDSQGKYTALLGSASTNGLPLNLFTAGQAHWLEAQPAGSEYAEQPRVMLVGVPYAMKAADADTLGGLPASAFLQQPTASSPGAFGSSANPIAGNGTILTPTGTSSSGSPNLHPSGTKNYIPVWTGPSTAANSIMYQANGNSIGVGTTTPGATLDVKGGINTSSAYNIGGVAFALGSSSTGNVFLGFAGNSTTTGGFNTGSGYQALLSNTTGIQNTASGAYALNVNTAGSYNTAYGFGALSSNSSGIQNTASGFDALFSTTTGNENTGSGYDALFYTTTGSGNTAYGYNTLADNTTGGNSTAYGANALASTTVGGNTAYGYNALSNNTTGSYNTASGNEALYENTTGNYNTASGHQALEDNSGGSNNTASGFDALFSSTTGSNNTATGYVALGFNGSGSNNTATGYQALSASITGGNNTADGSNALFNNTGSNNTADGSNALLNNTGGSNNTATGADALSTLNFGNGSNNTASGYKALANNSTGSNNIAIGYIAATNVSGGNSNNIHIGNSGSSGDNGVTRIGASGNQTSFYAAGIVGVNVSGATVIVSSNGQLGVASSSRRYKEDIHDMGDASEGLMRLRPVTFRYKEPFDDGTKPMQYGLIAEEVAEVYPDLVARSADGQIETVKYQLLDPMLLNEVQRQQKEMQAQQTEIRDQKTLVLAQQSQLKTQQALVRNQQIQLRVQQTQIAELASQMKVVQASLHARRGSGRAKLASARIHAQAAQPATATVETKRVTVSPEHGGN